MGFKQYLVAAGAFALAAHAMADDWVQFMENTDGKSYYARDSVKLGGSYSQITVVNNRYKSSVSYLFRYVVNCRARTMMQVTGEKFGSHWGKGVLSGQTVTPAAEEQPLGKEGPGSALY